MAVRVVTDSTSDLPPQVAQELGVVVVPLNVHFGTEQYRDGIDISADEFYRRLIQGSVFPTTSQPSPGTFLETYNALAEETDEIISIHFSSKLSRTFDSALLAKQDVKKPCQIEVVDSKQASMGIGLVVIAAARAAQGGASLSEVVEVSTNAVDGIRTFFTCDTLEYLRKGGRIGKVSAFLGSLLNIKPILTVKDGEAHPLERVRTRSKALDRLYELVANLSNIADMTLAYSTNQEDADKLAQRLSAHFPIERMYKARFGPVLGTHIGPGAVGVAVRLEEAVN